MKIGRYFNKAMALAVVIVVAAVTSFVVSRRIEPSPSKFTKESYQTRFMSFATTVSGTQKLNLAKVKQVEMFERKSEASLFWDRLKLPDVVVSATVPVEYNFSVELNYTWQMDLIDGTMHILAPALTPETPAPDISQLRFEVKKGSLFRSENKVTQSLQNEMTELLQERAKAAVALAREPARTELEKIAATWLRREGQNVTVKVQFADEARPLHPSR